MWLLKNYSIFWRNFWTGMILSSSWVKLTKKVKKEICHPGNRTPAKKSNDFQKMISVDFGQPFAALWIRFGGYLDISWVQILMKVISQFDRIWWCFLFLGVFAKMDYTFWTTVFKFTQMYAGLKYNHYK